MFLFGGDDGVLKSKVLAHAAVLENGWGATSRVLLILSHHMQQETLHGGGFPGDLDRVSIVGLAVLVLAM